MHIEIQQALQGRSPQDHFWLEDRRWTSDALRHSIRCVRTTLDIEDVLLRELRGIQKRDGGTLGSIVSRLLSEALGRRSRRPSGPAFRWTARKMAAMVDLQDKEALYAVLDRPDRAAEP
jgi:hypothetical protein